MNCVSAQRQIRESDSPEAVGVGSHQQSSTGNLHRGVGGRGVAVGLINQAGERGPAFERHIDLVGRGPFREHPGARASPLRHRRHSIELKGPGGSRGKTEPSVGPGCDRARRGQSIPHREGDAGGRDKTSSIAVDHRSHNFAARLLDQLNVAHFAIVGQGYRQDGSHTIHGVLGQETIGAQRNPAHDEGAVGVRGGEAQIPHRHLGEGHRCEGVPGHECATDSGGGSQRQRHGRSLAGENPRAGTAFQRRGSADKLSADPIGALE